MSITTPHQHEKEEALSSLNYRILVVDDEPSLCQALAMGLASTEFTVDVAANGERGVELACTGKYDIVIVDLCLPDMDGMQVIRAIKANHPEVIPIVVTAHSTEESTIEARQSGVSHYLEKPFTLKSIKAAVAEGLAARNAARD